MTKRWDRRSFLKMGGLGAAAAMLPLALQRKLAGAEERPDDRRFLFVVGAFGGGSIIDSFLPLVTSEVQAPGKADELVAYPEALVKQPAGSNLRCVSGLDTGDLFRTTFALEEFLTRHHEQMAVVPVLNSSVNHIVAQKRAVTGAGVHGGKTIMEAVAERHGAGMPLPNCNMASGGYIQPGDAPLDAQFRAEIIADPVLFAASTHGHLGQPDLPPETAIAQARSVRERLEEAGEFGQRFGEDPLRARYLDLRKQRLPQMESAEIIHKLMLFEESTETPLSDYGLKPLPGEERERLQGAFPAMMSDPLESQAALAFLLARYGVSCSIAFGPSANVAVSDSILETPLAFDYSHTDHVTAQSVMWSRILRVVDGLVGLLKEQPYDADDPGAGDLWSRSMIYIATDFGRSRQRPAGATRFSTGHDLNNGNLLISPLVLGNRVWGGVDPSTALTFGDRGDGERVTFREGHLYSAIAQAMDVEFAQRLDMGFVVG